MKRVVVFLTMLVAVSTANPVFQAVFTEMQVAPDSFERLEVNPANWESGYPFDLSGCQLVTRAGVATINDGVEVPDESTRITIDHSNVTGPFALNDTTDTVELRTPGGSPIWRLLYPYPTQNDPTACWLPPPGASCAMHYDYGFWPWEVDGGVWYMDETPTFGALNDDTVGGITGVVYDDRLLPVPYVWVHFAAPLGGADASTDETGTYVLHPTGPGTFQVSAQKQGYLTGYYPDSVHVAANQWVDSVDILLARVDLAENMDAAPQKVALCQRGRSLVLTADRLGTALVTVYDNLGRVRMSKSVNLVPGSNEVPLCGLSSGVYFAGCRFREGTITQKLVFY
jgi:hypothetical protein